jgi:V8-like Glu-specific endopeptidase
MRKLVAGLAAVALTAGLAGPGLADGPSPLRALTTADESRGWDGVGRIDLGDGGFCTGALISERLVLTAAHCLFDKDTARPLPPGQITFLAGWRDGVAAADRQVRRAVPHPEFDPAVELTGEIRHDIALLELDHPIRNGAIGAFPTNPGLEAGREVGVVSYAHDRSERPALQEVCQILGREQGYLVMSCDADFGASGAPVFAWQDGRPTIVSVVSAKAQVRDQKVSLGSDMGPALDELRALVAASDGVFRRHAVTTRGRIDTAGGRDSTGAKFLRP